MGLFDFIPSPIAKIGTAVLANAAFPGIGLLAMGAGFLSAPSSPDAEQPRPENAGQQFNTQANDLPIPYTRGTPPAFAGNVIWESEPYQGKSKLKWYKDVAFGLCITSADRPKTLLRWWKNDKEMEKYQRDFDAGDYTHNKGETANQIYFYDGKQTEPDPTIQYFKEKAGERVPTWKGLSYAFIRKLGCGYTTRTPDCLFEVSDKHELEIVNEVQPGVFTATASVFYAGYIFTYVQGVIKKISANTMEVVATLTLAANDNISGNRFMCIGDGNIFLVSSEGTLIVIDPVTMQKKARGYAGDVVLGTDGNKYFCAQSHVSNGSNIQPPGNPWTGKWTLIPDNINDGETKTWSAGTVYATARYATCMFYNNGYLYMGSENNPLSTPYHHFKKVQVLNNGYELKFLGIVQVAMATDPTTYLIEELVVDDEGVYVYTSEASPTPIIHKIRISDVTEVDNYTLDHSDEVIEMILNNGFLYLVLVNNSTADVYNIWKIRISDMTLSARVKFNSLKLDSVCIYKGMLAVGTRSQTLYLLNIEDLSTITSLNVGAANDQSFLFADSNFLYLGATTNDIYKIRFAGLDVLPSNIAYDALTNGFFGAGMPTTMWNQTITAETDAWCADADRDLLMSINVNQQMRMNDLLAYILSHHDGFIRWEAGKFDYMQYKSETADVDFIINNNILIEKNKSPVQKISQASKEKTNEVLVAFMRRVSTTKNNGDIVRKYRRATAKSRDPIDIKTNGLDSKTVRLDGIMLLKRADFMATRIKRKSMCDPAEYQFAAGLKNIDILQGSVHTLTDSGLEVSNQKIRILQKTITPDYKVPLKTVEEITTIHDLKAADDLDDDATKIDLYIESENPDSGVLITVINQTSGEIFTDMATPFSIKVGVEDSVVLVAPEVAGKTFQWLEGEEVLTSSNTHLLEIASLPHTLTAKYTDAVAGTNELEVISENPDGGAGVNRGVDITYSGNTYGDVASGTITTPNSIIVNSDDSIVLTAPATYGGYDFSYFSINGVILTEANGYITGTRKATIPMNNANRQVRVHYKVVSTSTKNLTVQSVVPASGVSVYYQYTFFDNTITGSGDTEFVLTLESYASIRLIAPVLDGKTFLGWYEGITLLTTSLTLDLDMNNANHTIIATYDDPTNNNLIIHSENPITGLQVEYSGNSLGAATGIVTTPKTLVVGATDTIELDALTGFAGKVFDAWIDEAAIIQIDGVNVTIDGLIVYDGSQAIIPTTTSRTISFPINSLDHTLLAVFKAKALNTLRIESTCPASGVTGLYSGSTYGFNLAPWSTPQNIIVGATDFIRLTAPSLLNKLFLRWKKDGAEVSTDRVYTVEMASEDHTMVAEYGNIVYINSEILELGSGNTVYIAV